MKLFQKSEITHTITGRRVPVYHLSDMALISDIQGLVMMDLKTCFILLFPGLVQTGMEIRKSIHILWRISWRALMIGVWQSYRWPRAHWILPRDGVYGEKNLPRARAIVSKLVATLIRKLIMI